MGRKTRDFTTGNPTKELLLFSLPLIVSMILQNLYNMADSVIVGRYVGENALAAVSNTSSITTLMLMLISGVTMGMSVVVSQYYGAKDEKNVKKAVCTSFYMIVGLSVIFTIVGIVLARPILQLINTPAEIIDDSAAYLHIIFAGTIATTMYNMASQMSRSIGDSITPMIVLLITCILNVFLNILFVTTFNMGVPGVAYATIIATAISAAVCWIILWRKAPMLHPNKEAAKFDKESFIKVARIGLPSALQSSSVSLGALLVQSMVNGFGGTVMAAFGGAVKIEALISFPPGGITQGLQVFVGQNVGAGKFDRVKKGFWSCFWCIVAYSVFSALVMCLLGGQLMRIYTEEATSEMIDIGHTYLIVAGLGAFFCGMVYQTRSSLVGAGDASAAVYISVTELGVRLIAAFLLSRTSLGYLGVFLGSPIGWIAGSALGFIRYGRGNWKKKRLVKEAPATESNT